MSCNIESAVTDLPDPDSPTNATISPLSTEKEMFFKAVVVLFSEIKSIERFRTLNNGFAAVIYQLRLWINVLLV